MSASFPPDSYTFESFFPTTVLMADYLGADELNPTLLDSVYRVRDDDQAGREASLAQYGVGYTSFFSNVRLLNYPGFLELAEFITRFGHGFAQHLDLDLSEHALGMLNYWVNINPTYSFHHIHIHADAVFSGVYYVNAPAEDAGGEILFKDPRAGAAMLPLPVKRKTHRNSDTTTVAPHAGRLLMFPAWLPHGVNQNLGPTDRVSISYNIGLKRKSELPTHPAR